MSLGRLWLIGCGNMGGAMLRRWIETGVVAASDVDVVNRTDRDLPEGVRQARELPDGPLPDMVMLAMKPQQIDEIARSHAARMAGVPILMSILAGVEAPALAARFEAGAIVRAMPNLPVALGKGVVGLHSDGASADERESVAALMAPLGLVEWVADAGLFDAVTALAGSGPGFLYRFIDALAEGGAALGLPADQAQRLAVATVEGAGLLAAASDDRPAALADKVASKGGSTRAGLNVLDADGALKVLLRETLAAAERRNREMAAMAR
ncbi:pyrroline-5-carboxylate reductase [Sphingomonas sp. Leaf357]|uniref:pyrroline-5-carboxylate reductase family protein n=1 Tax=Sphingomonas sp. Leaf357 TaxID=1736350 RepID=UPI0006F25397|nr:pyrroline-5-carboxylate reductase dimerization domain-containing protein [Sphingomonas sp. Leaf357]KQS01564.1 pyrroline-5-carboxylate reductase [Sphingomonas sp. Leaf357]